MPSQKNCFINWFIFLHSNFTGLFSVSFRLASPFLPLSFFLLKTTYKRPGVRRLADKGHSFKWKTPQWSFSHYAQRALVLSFHCPKSTPKSTTELGHTGRHQERFGNHEESEKRAKTPTTYMIHCSVLMQCLFPLINCSNRMIWHYHLHGVWSLLVLKNGNTLLVTEEASPKALKLFP